jgi:hypothetical protein
MATTDDTLLTEILGAEREIRRQIDDLQLRSEQGLAGLDQALAREVAQEGQRLGLALDAALAGAEAAAVRDAGTMLAAAEDYARRLECLETARLERIVRDMLGSILPEGTHDRQDEQG